MPSLNHANLLRNRSQHHFGRHVSIAQSAIDIETDDAAACVVIHDYAGSDLARVNAWPILYIDVDGVSFGVVMRFHGRKSRSRKALCTVSPSSSMTTRKCFCNSSMNIQAR